MKKRTCPDSGIVTDPRKIKVGRNEKRISDNILYFDKPSRSIILMNTTKEHENKNIDTWNPNSSLEPKIM